MELKTVLADRGYTGIRLYQQGERVDLERDVLKILTLHSAKGLEFPVVYCLGFDSHVFFPRPFVDGGDESVEIKAGRNLAYVGATRAMVDLTVTCHERFPLEFIGRIDPGLFEHIKVCN